jgi:hypothetical protein
MLVSYYGSKYFFPDMDKPKIYADFNNLDKEGRLRLITSGSLEDICNQKTELFPGMNIIVYDDEFSIDGEVAFSADEEIWVAKIDRDRLKRK